MTAAVEISRKITIVRCSLFSISISIKYCGSIVGITACLYLYSDYMVTIVLLSLITTVALVVVACTGIEASMAISAESRSADDGCRQEQKSNSRSDCSNNRNKN